MNNLKIADNLQKTIKQGVSFVLVGTMVVTAGSFIKNNRENRDNGRYHDLYQTTLQTREIEVSQGVNLYLNDHVFIPRDVNGNEVPPFIYNGTTYLPIRAITSALGCEVGFANNKAIITRKENPEINPGVEWRKDIESTPTSLSVSTNISIEVDGTSFTPRDVNGNLVDVFVVNGTTYVPLRALCNNFNIPVVWDSRNNRIYLGSHIDLVDPNTYANQDDQFKQNCCNLALVGIQQWKMDVDTLRIQFDKYESFIEELINNYALTWGTSYHDELEALHATLTNNYSTILGILQKYTDEHIQLEWDDIANKMNYKEQLSVEGYAFFPSIYDAINERMAKLNACCTDLEIAKLYQQLNDIIGRYNDSLGKSKILSN